MKKLFYFANIGDEPRQIALCFSAKRWVSRRFSFVF